MHTTLSPPASSQPTTPYAPSVGCAVLTCLLSSGISVLSTLQEGYPVWFLYSHNFQVKTNVENLSCISFPHTNKGRPYLKMMKTGWPLTWDAWWQQTRQCSAPNGVVMPRGEHKTSTNMWGYQNGGGLDDGCYYSPDRFTWIARPQGHQPGWHSGRWTSPSGGVQQPSCPRGFP